jgi:hypothetical protein
MNASENIRRNSLEAFEGAGELKRIINTDRFADLFDQ